MMRQDESFGDGGRRPTAPLPTSVVMTDQGEGGGSADVKGESPCDVKGADSQDYLMTRTESRLNETTRSYGSKC